MKSQRQTLTPVNNSKWLDLPAKITPTSLILPRDLTYDKWAEIGPKIARIKRFTAWALSDWLNYGEARYGETYAQAVDATGFEPNYLAIIKSVGASVEPSRRRESLSFSHHRLVAPLEPDEQERFLADADAHGWSREELRDAIKSLNTPTGELDQDADGDFVAESAAEQSTPAPSQSLRARRIAMAFDWIAKWESDAKAMGLEKFHELNRRQEALESRFQALNSARAARDAIRDSDSMQYGRLLGQSILDLGRLITDMILLRTESEFQLAVLIARGELPPAVRWRNRPLNRIWWTIRHQSFEFYKVGIAHYFAELDEDIFSWSQFGLADELSEDDEQTGED